MHRLRVALITLVFAGAGPMVRAQESQLAALSWLAGCWSVQDAEAGSVEHWLPLAGGTMLGVGRTVKNGKTIDYEFMKILLNPQGQLVLVAKPSRKPEAEFTATQLSADAVAFENLQHDFPQRVIYRLAGADRLAARIEGMRQGAAQGVDFPMRRVSCDQK